VAVAVAALGVGEVTPAVRVESLGVLLGELQPLTATTAASASAQPAVLLVRADPARAVAMDSVCRARPNLRV